MKMGLLGAECPGNDHWFIQGPNLKPSIFKHHVLTNLAINSKLEFNSYVHSVAIDIHVTVINNLGFPSTR